MDLKTTKNREFKKRGIEIIDQKGELLAFVRYANYGGSRAYFLLRSENEFKTFLDTRRPKDSITLFKTTQKLTEGIVTDSFIEDILNRFDRPASYVWIILFPEIESSHGNWYEAEDKEELEEALKTHENNHVCIFEEQDWLDEAILYHAYEPDEDGYVRPGAY